MLDAYTMQVQRLIGYDDDQVMFNLDDLITYVNIARSQLAADTECLRQPAVIQTVAGQRAYSWASAAFVGQGSLPVPIGLAGVLTAKNMTVLYGASGATRMYVRSWPYFNYYFIQNPVPKMGRPRRWAVFEPGIGGTFYIDPIPDNGLYTLQLDGVCIPAPLAADTDPEPIPYPWTDAVPYYAAYLAGLSAEKPIDAAKMLDQYRLFALRGTQMTTSSQLPDAFPGGEGARAAGLHQPIGAMPAREPG